MVARPLREDAVAARRRQGRRRHHVDDAWPRLREGRRPHLDRLWRVLAGIPQADARRRGRPALLGIRHFADRASLEPQRAGRAHEHPHGRDLAPLVRRRRRPDAGARPPPHQDDPDTVAFHRAMQFACEKNAAVADYAQIQGLVRRVFLSCRTATSRAASAASFSTGCIRARTRAAGMPISTSSRMSAALFSSSTATWCAPISTTTGPTPTARNS